MFINRFSLLAVLAYLLSLLMVACRPVSSEPASLSNDISVQLSEAFPQDDSTAHAHKRQAKTEYIKLHNRCGGNVQIWGKKVHAGDDKGGRKLDELIVRSVMYRNEFRIEIYSNKSQSYLCFNKKGKLMARFKFSLEDCTFKESLDNNSWFELVQRRKNGETWSVGFNKKGKPLRGSADKMKMPHSFQFQKERVGFDGKRAMAESSHERLVEAVHKLEQTDKLEPDKHRHSHHQRRSGHRKDRHTGTTALKPRR